jgi:hypothetical protein
MPNETNNYDLEPVEYCAKCYSLKIKHEDAIDADCCMECGSTEIASASIDEWERLYQRRYGHKYVERNNDPRKSIYFQMPISKLKTKLYKSELLNAIIYHLYPDFPQGLSRENKIILLFDKIAKDNKIDDLRYYLYNIHRMK